MLKKLNKKYYIKQKNTIDAAKRDKNFYARKTLNDKKIYFHNLMFNYKPESITIDHIYQKHSSK